MKILWWPYRKWDGMCKTSSVRDLVLKELVPLLSGQVVIYEECPFAQHGEFSKWGPVHFKTTEYISNILTTQKTSIWDDDYVH